MILKRTIKNFALLLILCLPFLVNAQRRRGGKVWNLPNYDKKALHFGFSLGISTMDFSMRHAKDFLVRDLTGEYLQSEVYAVESTGLPGFQFGGLANFRMSNYFDFRTLFVLSFTQRNIDYTIRNIKRDGAIEWDTETVKIESIHTQFPLLLKLKANRLNNYRPFFITGINPNLDLAAGSKEDEPYVHLKAFDVFYEAGFGVDFYLYYFKFATELKYSFGIMDMLDRDGSIYTKGVGELYTHMFTLSFNFE